MAMADFNFGISWPKVQWQISGYAVYENFACTLLRFAVLPTSPWCMYLLTRQEHFNARVSATVVLTAVFPHYILLKDSKKMHCMWNDKRKLGGTNLKLSALLGKYFTLSSEQFPVWILLQQAKVCLQSIFWAQNQGKKIESKYLKKKCLGINMNIVSNGGQMFFCFVDIIFSNGMTLALFHCSRKQNFWA